MEHDESPGWREGALLLVVAATARVLTAASLGGGAPFGPDGTGAEAAVTLGGHLYPLHVLAIRLAGSARTLSLVTGTAAVGLLWGWCRRVGLPSRGAWMAALLPLAVFTSALSAGDAPALALVMLGALLATGGRLAAVLGGALALASVAVKPIALPALVLLLARPWSLLGVLAALPFAAGWLGPLWRPLPTGGLLGTWWQGTGGLPPASAEEAGRALAQGVAALATEPAWAGAWLALLALAGFLRAPRPTRPALASGVVGLLALATLLGDRLAPRYLTAALWALLPWIPLPRWTAALLLWPAVALVTQVAAERARLDPEAGVPDLPVLAFPKVDAVAIFEDCSTPGATTLRLRAESLARSLPPGATIAVERRPHGREGELVWPLRAARPDVEVEVVGP